MFGISVGIMDGAGGLATSYESIQTVTVGSGGASSVDFTSIPSTYTHLQVRFMNRSSSGSALSTFVRLNGDTSTSNYSVHRLFGDGSSVTSQGWATGNFTAFVTGTTGGSDTANTFGVGIIDILDYKNTNKNTTIRALGGYDANGTGQVSVNSSAWINTTAVNAIRLDSQNTFVQNSVFALYGIKG
jgi:hypothetical protein